MLKNHYREIKSELEKIVQGSHRKAEVHREAKNRTNRKQKLTGQKKAALSCYYTLNYVPPRISELF